MGGSDNKMPDKIWAYIKNNQELEVFILDNIPDFSSKIVATPYIRADRIEALVKKHFHNTNISALFNDMRALVRGEEELLEDKSDE